MRPTLIPLTMVLEVHAGIGVRTAAASTRKLLIVYPDARRDAAPDLRLVVKPLAGRLAVMFEQPGQHLADDRPRRPVRA